MTPHIARFLRAHSVPLIAAAFFLVNILIRLPNLSFPNYPVFDEAYYATYAAAYADREAHIDIHPPLGGMLYSLPLLVVPKASYESAQYVRYDFAGGSTPTPQRVPYGTFPYYWLRLLSACFGGVLAVAVFLFTNELSGNRAAAFLAASFVTLENSIILETKLILVNGMLLAFGFLGLYLLLKNRPAGAGVMAGLAVSVKLIAGIFGIMGLMLAAFRKNGMKRTLSFMGAGAATFLALTILVESVWIPVSEKQRLFDEKIISPLRALPEWQTSPPTPWGGFLTSLIPDAAKPYIEISGVQALFSLSGYTLSGGGADFMKSSWYGWPVMIGAFPYYFESGDVSAPALALVGNPVVWGLGTAGILIGIKRLFERARRRRKGESAREKDAVELLAFSYLAYLALFLLFVRRDAFLYHYFPALILGIILFSILFSEFAGRKPLQVRFWLYTSAFSLAALGFIFMAPFTYGIPFF